MEDAKTHFEWVLRTAEARRAEMANKIADLQRDLRELDSTIVGLWKLSGQSPSSTPARAPIQRTLPDALKYSEVSVRWAILLLLSEADSPQSATEIADALRAGGIHSQAKDFNNNVSSVLSEMKSARSEVDVIDGKWQMTETGRSAIEYIKATKLKRAFRKQSRADAVTSAPAQAKGGDSE